MPTTYTYVKKYYKILINISYLPNFLKQNILMHKFFFVIVIAFGVLFNILNRWLKFTLWLKYISLQKINDYDLNRNY